MGRREKNIVGLDIGSTKVCTLIATTDPSGASGLEPVGFGIAESKGVKKGAIINLEAAVESIKKSVSEAEARAGCEVDTVYVGLAGPHIKSFNSRGVTSIPTRSREINSDDVRRVIETARAVAISTDREIIHILPQEFTVDDQCGIGDPLGMVGTRLEVNVHIVTSSTTAAQNIITAVNRSGLLVGDTVLEPIAVGEAILSEDEKELGSVLVDIGGGKTNIAIYHHGAVRHTVVVPLGGELFTNDIAVGLRTSIPEAERLKREQGCALGSMVDGERVFEVAGVGTRRPRAIAQSLLTDILQPRAEEIVHIVRNEIRSAGYERQAGAGVVVTGGGSMLQGFVELAEEILDMPVRVGTSAGFGELLLEEVQQERDTGQHAARVKMPPLMGPEFATVTGLVLYGDRRRKMHDFHEHPNWGFKKLVSKFRSFL
jgi:cell division protein FtsA